MDDGVREVPPDQEVDVTVQSRGDQHALAPGADLVQERGDLPRELPGGNEDQGEQLTGLGALTGGAGQRARPKASVYAGAGPRGPGRHGPPGSSTASPPGWATAWSRPAR